MQQVDLTYVSSKEDLFKFWMWTETVPTTTAFDLETSGVDPYNDVIRLVQVGDADTAFAFPMEWAGPCFEWMEQYEGNKIAHNAAFDLSFLEEYGLKKFIQPDKIHDTMFMAKILWPNQIAGLKPLTEELVDPEAKDGQKLLKDAMRKGGWTWATVPTDLPEYWVYGCLDVIYTVRLAQRLDTEFGKNPPSLREIYELEMYVSPAYRRARRAGLEVDRAAAQTLDDHYKARIAELAQDFQKLYDCSITQNRAIAQALEDAGVELTERTATGLPKVTAQVLETIDHPIANTVLEYRGMAKLQGTYTKNILAKSEKDGRLHAETRQIGADTGRSSMSSPNLQNIPQRQGTVIRRLLVASEGHVLISCDYSQQELRILAHLSQDPGMLVMFDGGQDPFVYIGSMMFPEDPLTDKSDPRRDDIKTLVYGLIYGMGVKKYAANTGKTLEESKIIRDRFFETFPGVQEFMRETTRAGEKTGLTGQPHAFTVFGRKVACDHGYEYKLSNYRIQGTAADQMKMAVAGLINAELDQYLRIVIHDEVVMEVPEDLAPEICKKVERIMAEAGADAFSLPFEAEADVAYNFAAFKEK